MTFVRSTVSLVNVSIRLRREAPMMLSRRFEILFSAPCQQRVTFGRLPCVVFFGSGYTIATAIACCPPVGPRAQRPRSAA
jgi:hypothetical protein